MKKISLIAWLLASLFLNQGLHAQESMKSEHQNENQRSCGRGKKPLGHICVHVCPTNTKMEGMGGLVCQDGKPGMTPQEYENALLKLPAEKKLINP